MKPRPNVLVRDKREAYCVLRIEIAAHRCAMLAMTRLRHSTYVFAERATTRQDDAAGGVDSSFRWNDPAPNYGNLFRAGLAGGSGVRAGGPTTVDSGGGAKSEAGIKFLIAQGDSGKFIDVVWGSYVLSVYPIRDLKEKSLTG